MAPSLFMSMKGPFKVCLLMLMVCATASLWMASGTLPYLISIMMGFIHPLYFLPSAFIITCIFSLFIGSAVGTTGIIGVLFITLARAAGLPVTLVAGAVISAAYFGERTTPLSSCANLVAEQTRTSVYQYIQRVFIRSIPPLSFTVLIYVVLSWWLPRAGSASSTVNDIHDAFNMNPLLLLPLALLVFLSILRTDVRMTILISAVSSVLMGLFLGNMSTSDILPSIYSGYHHAEGPLNDLLVSRGIKDLGIASCIILLTGVYAELLQTVGFIGRVEPLLEKFSQRFGRLAATMLTSIFTNAVGFSQTFAVITTTQMVGSHYDMTDSDEQLQFAEDLGNTAVVISPLTPWNLGATVTASLLSIGPEFIPYAFYLYLVPLYALWRSTRASRSMQKNTLIQ